MSTCDSSFRDTYLRLLLDQYKQSPNLNEFIGGHLDILDEIKENACSNLNWIPLDEAVEDHLTFYGNLVGFPRDHCSAKFRKFFGFTEGCEEDHCSDLSSIGGLCEMWACEFATGGLDDYTFEDDNLYRRFIKAKIHSNTASGSMYDLIETMKVLFNDDVMPHTEYVGEITLRVLRPITSIEQNLMPLIRKIAPTMPATNLTLTYSNTTPPGFGSGWGDFFCNN